MTEEEINKKAEKHCNEVLCNAHEKCNEVIKCRNWRSRRAGFFCGYEQALKDCEKEKAELKKACDETQELLDKQIEATYKLDKENAEMKEKLKPENCIEYLAKGGYVKFLCENGNEHDQLTKAKEIITELLKYTDTEAVEMIKEAEQFLKDSEVEK